MGYQTQSFLVSPRYHIVGSVPGVKHMRRGKHMFLRSVQRCGRHISFSYIEVVQTAHNSLSAQTHTPRSINDMYQPPQTTTTTPSPPLREMQCSVRARRLAIPSEQPHLSLPNACENGENEVRKPESLTPLAELFEDWSRGRSIACNTEPSSHGA